MVLQEMIRRACFFISHHVSIQREGDCPANQEPIRARTGVFVGTLIWNYPVYKHVGNKFSFVSLLREYACLFYIAIV